LTGEDDSVDLELHEITRQVLQRAQVFGQSPLIQAQLVQGSASVPKLVAQRLAALAVVHQRNLHSSEVGARHRLEQFVARIRGRR
jgi:hypothetical protein